VEILPNLFPILRGGEFYYSNPNHCPRYFQFKKSGIHHDKYPKVLDEITNSRHLTTADTYYGGFCPKHICNVNKDKTVRVTIQNIKEDLVYFKEILPGDDPVRGGRLGVKPSIFVSKYDLLFAGVVAHATAKPVKIYYYSLPSNPPTFFDSVTISTKQGEIYKEDIHTGHSAFDVINAVDKVIDLWETLAPIPPVAGVCTKCPYSLKCFHIHRLGISSMREVIDFSDRL
jgi:hypothetical protein